MSTNPVHPQATRRPGDRRFTATLHVAQPMARVVLGLSNPTSVQTWTLYGKNRKDALVRAGVDA